MFDSDFNISNYNNLRSVIQFFKKEVIKKLLFGFFLLFIFSEIYSQNTTSRLTIESGGSLNFYFNSLSKYKNGIAFNDYTKLRIYYNDTTNTGGAGIFPNWKLDVKANSPTIDGDAGNTLNLNTIEIEASQLIGVAGTLAGIQALTNSDVSLITGADITDPGTATVFISYYCGQSLTVTNNLLGKNPDYYVVDIIFTLGRN